MKKFIKLFLSCIILLSNCNMASSYPVELDPQNIYPELKYKEIDNERANKLGLKLKIWDGRISTIDFSQTDEIILLVEIGDPSKIVWFANQEITSNLANTIFVTPIKELDFEGRTKNEIPNMIVQTQDSNGNLKIYNFDIIKENSPVTNLGIIITKTPENNYNAELDKYFYISNDKKVDIDTIARGLKVAIISGYTDKDDPIIPYIENFLAEVRNGKSLKTAIEEGNLSLTLITKLGELGLRKVAYKEGSLKQKKDNTKKYTSQDILNFIKRKSSQGKLRPTSQDKKKLMKLYQEVSLGKDPLEVINKIKINKYWQNEIKKIINSSN